MKKILLVHTGGTIGSAFDAKAGCRVLSASFANMTLLEKYRAGAGLSKEDMENRFQDSGMREADRTFSENMTAAKLSQILRHIRQYCLDDFCGMMILHGTDTLAYSAALFSFALSGLPLPVMLVSGNRPPDQAESNANANFKAAVDLILEGIAPGVYVPYRNMDGTMWLHMGASLMQSPNFSEDFFSGSENQAFPMTRPGFDKEAMLCALKTRAEKRRAVPMPEALSEDVLLIQPYTGMDYARLGLENVRCVVHGSYHSGTVCVERQSPDEAFGTRSILWLSAACEKRHIPLFVAPSRLDRDQYSSALDAVVHGRISLLSMTTEAAYAKAMVGLSLGLFGETLCQFMQDDICGEMI